MIRYAVIGTGWRSEFYARIAKALPETFQMEAWLCRNTDKMTTLNNKYGIYTTMCEDEIVNLKPDFIVCAVNKAGISKVTEYWSEKGFPVLSETPAALDIDTLKHMKECFDNGHRIQVAEQYFLMPDISLIIAETKSGIIGEPISVTLSAMHDYHAVSVIRKLLNIGLENVSITGKTFTTNVTNTKTRYETLTDGKIIDAKQKHLIMEYESGKMAFYDFMSEQYRSPIRNKYINVRGTRGEIINDTVYYLDNNNIPTTRKLTAVNPYENRGLSYDEAAIANLMIKMKKYTDTGIEAYPFNEALYDAYLSILMDDAGNNSYETFAIKAFERGINVLCDKPAGVYSKQARNMMETYITAKNHKSDLLYGCIFHQRTYPVYIKIKEIIDSRKYGNIKRINWIVSDWYRSNAYYRSGSWRATWQYDGGGTLLNQCPHNLDLLTWICGTPKSVMGFCKVGKYHPIEVEDEVTAYLEWDNDVNGVFIASTGEAPGINRLEISLDNAILVCEKETLKAAVLDKPEIEYRNAAADDLFAKPAYEWFDIDVKNSENAYITVLEKFAMGEMVAKGEDAINSLYISNAVYLSSWTGQKVAIPIPGTEYEKQFELKFENELKKKL